jgi:hypothetical protein
VFPLFPTKVNNNGRMCFPCFHLNYLSSNVLSLYCIFDIQNLVLCLNREFMLKLQCKTTFNSVFVGKKIINIEKKINEMKKCIKQRKYDSISLIPSGRILVQ